jgi:hypothetical protein
VVRPARDPALGGGIGPSGISRRPSTPEQTIAPLRKAGMGWRGPGGGDRRRRRCGWPDGEGNRPSLQRGRRRSAVRRVRASRGSARNPASSGDGVHAIRGRGIWPRPGGQHPSAPAGERLAYLPATPSPGRRSTPPRADGCAGDGLTWGVSLSSVRSSAHAGASGLGVQTASRFEPIVVLAIPNQNNLTSGRRAQQPHHDPACGGQGSGGRDHSCCRHLRPCGLSVHPPGSVRT